MANGFSIDALREAMAKMPPAPLYDNLFAGPRVSSLIDEYYPPIYQHASVYPFRYGGMRIEQSRMFPFEQTCSRCNGTGDGGNDSTYCQHCKGAGASKIEGVMTGARDSMCLLTSSLPKKFPVAWSAGALPKRPAKGIRSVE